ncbi:MAG: biotin/lipoyl-containing protein, partial [Pseudomonadota bacterium]
LSGHSFEARLYAEDVPKGFLPATGTLTHLSFPPGVRADSGVRAGDTITPHYDPMIAKIIARGETRDHALARLIRALRQLEVAGSVTNHAFLRKLAAHPRFKAGDVDTGLIEADLEALSAAPVPCKRARSLAAITALGLGEAEASLTGFTLWAPLEQTVRLDWEGEAILATVATLGPRHFRVHLGETVHEVDRDAQSWRIDGVAVPACPRAIGDRVHVFWGNGYAFKVPDPLAQADGTASGGNIIEAPMPGQVKSVHVSPGAAVAAGDRLAVLEAMKMEHVLTAARDGVVAEVLVTAGAQVEAGAAMIRLESEAAA